MKLAKTTTNQSTVTNPIKPAAETPAPTLPATKPPLFAGARLWLTFLESDKVRYSFARAHLLGHNCPNHENLELEFEQQQWVTVLRDEEKKQPPSSSSMMTRILSGEISVLAARRVSSGVPFAGQSAVRVYNLALTEDLEEAEPGSGPSKDEIASYEEEQTKHGMYPYLTFDKTSERNWVGSCGPSWGHPLPRLVGIISYQPSEDPQRHYPVRSSRDPHPCKEPGKTVGSAEVLELRFSMETVMLHGSNLGILHEELIGGRIERIAINDASTRYHVQEIHQIR